MNPNEARIRRLVGEMIEYFRENLGDAVQGMILPTLVAVDSEAQTLELSFELKEWMRNPVGVLHGGMTAAIVDTTMGMLSRCSVFNEDGITPTVSMDVAYLAPIPVGTTLHVRARLTRRGGSFNHLTAEAWLPDAPEKLLATATGVYFSAKANGKK